MPSLPIARSSMEHCSLCKHTVRLSSFFHGLLVAVVKIHAHTHIYIHILIDIGGEGVADTTITILERVREKRRPPESTYF